MNLYRGFLLFLVFLGSFSFVSADPCDSFCLEEGYSYGTCRETSETKGFCDGEDEDVYGFAPCENFERCCCGYSEEIGVDQEIINKTDTSSSASSKSFAQEAFWPLVIIVVLLALAVIIKKMAFREEGKEKVTKE